MGRTAPFRPEEVGAMTTATSPVVGRVYGVERVCKVFGVPRSVCSTPGVGTMPCKGHQSP